MRVSQYYRLDVDQPSLDFVDVDLTTDIPVFVDPHSLRRMPSDWAEESRQVIQSFFQKVLDVVARGNHQEARQLMTYLSEPNETRLGYSSGRPKGRGLGKYRGQDVADALTASRAAQSGLLSDLEDSVLMVPGIGFDIVSDITTNLLRGMLVGYTQSMCGYYGIRMVQVNSGPVWHRNRLEWEEDFVDLPYAEGRRLLLVPKAIVRVKMDYDPGEYYRDFLAPVLQDVELANPRSSLVQILKNGRRRVTKKSIRAKYGDDKPAIVEITEEYTQALEAYKRAKSNASQPLSHEVIQELVAKEPTSPDWEGLLEKVVSCRPGQQSATDYHRAVANLLTALFYPALVTPKIEEQINEGRKRIDIAFTNAGGTGFFQWLILHRVPCKYVYAECKNYTGDLGNAELDQMIGRFSPRRSKVGLVLCRKFKNKNLFLKRCRDSALNDHGLVTVLDDSDLGLLVREAKAGAGPASRIEGLLKRRFDALT